MNPYFPQEPDNALALLLPEIWKRISSNNLTIHWPYHSLCIQGFLTIFSNNTYWPRPSLPIPTFPTRPQTVSNSLTTHWRRPSLHIPTHLSQSQTTTHYPRPSLFLIQSETSHFSQ